MLYKNSWLFITIITILFEFKDLTNKINNILKNEIIINNDSNNNNNILIILARKT
jgi:hypothetical protein